MVRSRVVGLASALVSVLPSQLNSARAHRNEASCCRGTSSRRRAGTEARNDRGSCRCRIRRDDDRYGAVAWAFGSCVRD